jgi:hypothetical protein
LAQQLGLKFDDNTGLEVNIDGCPACTPSSLSTFAAQPRIISAGDGAAAAIDMQSLLEGEPVQDWDSPPKKE